MKPRPSSVRLLEIARYLVRSGRRCPEATGVSLRKQVPVEMTDKPTAYRHIHRLNHATTRHGALRRHNEHRLYTPRNDPPPGETPGPHFLFGRCVRAEAAAVFSALLDFGSLSTLLAAEAAFLLVTSLFPLRAIRASPPPRTTRYCAQLEPTNNIRCSHLPVNPCNPGHFGHIQLLTKPLPTSSL